MYAIVKTGGKQYTVKPGDVLDVEKLEGEAGDKIALEVLFLNDGSSIITDADKLAGAVTAQIVDQHKGPKQIVFKFKKRKGYKRTNGHRQQLTRIAIVDVNGETAEAPTPKAPEGEPAIKETPAVEEPAVEEAPVAENVVEEPAEETAEETAEEPAAEEAPAGSATEDLNSMTVADLKALAKERGIALRSGARKAEIIETIENAE